MSNDMGDVLYTHTHTSIHYQSWPFNHNTIVDVEDRNTGGKNFCIGGDILMTDVDDTSVLGTETYVQTCEGGVTSDNIEEQKSEVTYD